MLSFREYLVENAYNYSDFPPDYKPGIRPTKSLLPVTDTVSKSGKRVHAATTNRYGFIGVEDSHAILFRKEIWVGTAHIDALEALLDHHSKSTVERDVLERRIDNGKIAIRFGYYYDGDFHDKPKNREMRF